MFKNVTVYRIGAAWSADLGAVEAQLQLGRFVECGATQPQSGGWVPPRGEAHAALAESIAGQLLLEHMSERKVLPGAVVKRRVDEMAQQIEATSGRKPGKKERTQLRDEALLELLPLAFTQQARTAVWIDPEQRTLVVGAASANRAEEIVGALIKALAGFEVLPLQTALSPAAAMAHWLATREAPRGFSIDRECELRAADESQAVVRYARHTLDIDEVTQHIADGKQPTRLALTWSDRLSFVLTDALQLKKLDFLDIVFEGASGGPDDGFDSKAAISTAELRRLLPELIDALGGELPAGALPTA